MSTPNTEQILRDIARYFDPRPTASASQWAEANIVVPYGPRPGPFSFSLSEYLREPVDCFSDSLITDVALDFASQTGKSLAIICGVAWTCVHDPTWCLWVFDAADSASDFSRERWRPIMEESETLERMIPKGEKRFDFASARQRFGGNVLAFVGANSPGKLASRPCRLVVMDEVDKYPSASEEADPIALAIQRTKRFPNPKRFRTSTPTVTEGPIWQEYLTGDQRRYFTPCPHCGKMVLWAWSKDFSMLARTGREAFVKWDETAKRDDGSWDLDKVFATAHFECPDCYGRIEEKHKPTAVRLGKWVPSVPAKGGTGWRSYHLPSFYCTGPQTSFGAIAVRFLREKESLQGLQAFITGELAEPWESQDSRSERTEIVSPVEAESINGDKVLTVDCQAVSPHFWAVAREWTVQGISRLIGAWRTDDWESVRRIQLACGVADHRVLVDSGDQTASVYEECLRYGAVAPGQGSLWVGWMPTKGRDRESKWLHEKTKTVRPYHMSRAPLQGQETRNLPLLLFNGERLLGTLAKLRRPLRDETARRWEVVELPGGPEVDGAVRVDMDEYWRQMDAKIEKPLVVGRTNKVEWRWVKRSAKWPEHLLDCEVMQLLAAMFFRWFPAGTPVERTEK